MRIAFKEWAVVVDALGRGEQIVILRKGGISEGRGGFHVEHSEFLLFPTLFHQQRESVLPHAQKQFDEHWASRLAAEPATVSIQFLGTVAQWRQLESLSDAEGLRGQHIWRDEVIASRFEWGRQKNIFALAVRVFRLPQPVELPMRPAYGGCKSWVELETDVDTTQATPVLSETDWARRLADFSAALPLMRA